MVLPAVAVLVSILSYAFLLQQWLLESRSVHGDQLVKAGAVYLPGCPCPDADVMTGILHLWSFHAHLELSLLR